MNSKHQDSLKTSGNGGTHAPFSLEKSRICQYRVTIFSFLSKTSSSSSGKSGLGIFFQARFELKTGDDVPHVAANLDLAPLNLEAEEFVLLDPNPPQEEKGGDLVLVEGMYLDV